METRCKPERIYGLHLSNLVSFKNGIAPIGRLALFFQQLFDFFPFVRA
jgi:hypothetical protein